MSSFIERLGKLERENVNFSLYEDAPELYDKLGEAGVKFVDSPKWLSWLHGNNPFTVGNTIIVPEKPDWFESIETYKIGQESYASYGEFIAGEEVPHVAQYRDKGLLGFLGKYVSEILKHGIRGESTYDVEDTIEGFHYQDPAEKKRLFEMVLPQEDRTYTQK